MKNQRNHHSIIGYRQLLVVSVCAVPLLFSSIVTASSNSLQTKIDRLFEISGADKAVARYPEQLRGTTKRGIALEMLKVKEDSSELNVLMEDLELEMNSIVTLPKLQNMLNAHFASTMNGAMLDEMIGFYESPLGKNVTEISSKSEEVMQSAEFQQFVAEFPNMIRNEARVDLINEALSTLKTHEAMANFYVDAGIASIIAMVAEMPEEVQNDLEFQEEMNNVVGYVESHRPQLRSQYKNILSAFEYYQFRNFSDRKFEQYSAAMLTDASKAMHAATFSGMAQYTKETSYDIGEYLGKELSELVVAAAEVE